MRGAAGGAPEQRGIGGDVARATTAQASSLVLVRCGPSFSCLQPSVWGIPKLQPDGRRRSGRRPTPEDGRRRTGLGNNGRQRPQTTATPGGSSPGRAALPGDGDVWRRSRTTAAREEIRRGKGGAERNQWRRRRLRQREEVEEENHEGEENREESNCIRDGKGE